LQQTKGFKIQSKITLLNAQKAIPNVVKRQRKSTLQSMNITI